MERFYNHRHPNASDLPDFSSSDIFMCDGRSFKKTEDVTNENALPFASFLREFQSLFWFSYRKDFQAIAPSSYTSDVGWGCMLRSGQMMLAHVLALHVLGHDWNRLEESNQNVETNLQKRKDYLKILRWFEDSPHAEFGVHQIAKLGLKFGKNIGEWFGPSTIAMALGELINSKLPDFDIYLSDDAVLYLDEILAKCEPTENSSTPTPTPAWKSIFILIPLRLGLNSLKESYVPVLKKLYSIPQFVGIIGGKPRAAMYFVAVQDDFVFYLDPHTLQPTQAIIEGEFSTQSYHCAIPRKMPLTSLDPSLAIGFYCKNRKELDDFWSSAREFSENENYLFGLEEAAPEYRKKGGLSLEEFEDDIVIM
eukprot:TRINITY_DN1691_c0_g1_i4.p1 TRINITY_DN1691_c0_g1~~TRINITY_DN1691_c0_g1_i4.p1  ORF type:complete len:365 (-),score=99.20 TRINITY_DN1691_c0_g1_i4:1301-2395(-)